jgi:regulator of PEP synthase PpsR (kinase-PPPase family)
MSTTVRAVFYVSDGTGITVEKFGHSLLTQFTGYSFVTDRIPFVDDADKANDAAQRIRDAGEAHECRPIVIHSIVNPAIADILAATGALILDVFAPFIAMMEEELGTLRQSRVGHAHGMGNAESYHKRINAMNYALAHDDGVASNYDDADVILTAVSRAGKTPTCVYLALHYGVRAANYPLVEADLESDRLPPRLRAYKRKVFGLTIDPERLAQVREERRPHSKYAQLDTCQREVSAAEAMFETERIPTLSATHMSIEEIASKVMSTLRLKAEIF